MGLYAIKTLLSAAIIVAVSELAKRSTLAGSLLASLPLVSLVAMVWLQVETGDSARVAALSRGIFWLVLPSLVLFAALPWLLERKLPFYAALGLSCLLTILAYALMVPLLKKLGVTL